MKRPDCAKLWSFIEKPTVWLTKKREGMKFKMTDVLFDISFDAKELGRHVKKDQ